MAEKQIEFIEKLADYIMRTVKPTRWDPKTYPEKFTKRSPAEILKSRERNYMGSCIDASFALATRLKQTGFSPTIVVQELVNEHTKEPGLHFAVEVKADKKLYTVELNGVKKTLIYSGKYNPSISKPNLKSLSVRRFSAKNLNPSEPIYKFFKMSHPEDFKKVFKHVKKKHIDKAFQKMRESDNPKLFSKIQRRRYKVRRV
jgi:hypothetical protein